MECDRREAYQDAIDINDIHIQHGGTHLLGVSKLHSTIA
jgi:hypothetical protein